MDQVTVEQAARILGIKEESLRKRIGRGKLRSEKDEDGKLLVYVDGIQTVREGSEDRSRDVSEKHPDLAPEPVDDLHDRISYLERQLEERESCRRADHIITGLIGRGPALEAALGEQETAESRDVGAAGAAEAAESVGHPPSSTGCSEGPDRPPDTAEWLVRGPLHHPWWKRVYGR